MKTKVAKRDVHHLKMSLRISIGTPNHKKNIFHFYILNNIFTLLVQIYIVAIIPSVILEVLVCCLKLSSTCKQKNLCLKLWCSRCFTLQTSVLFDMHGVLRGSTIVILSFLCSQHSVKLCQHVVGCFFACCLNN